MKTFEIGKQLRINNKTHKSLKIYGYVMFLWLQAGCCGDIWSDSPQELLEKNDHVFLGRLVSQQIIQDLGTVDYFDIPTKFVVFEYRYVPIIAFKGATADTINMWACHRIAPIEEQNLLSVTVGDSVLVYGNEIKERKDLIRVMNSMVYIDSLIIFLETGGGWYEIRNTIDADTTLVSRIRASDSLVKTLQFRRLTGIVLEPNDLYMWTTKEFIYNKICYHGNLPWDTTADRAKYLSALADAAAKLNQKKLRLLH